MLLPTILAADAPHWLRAIGAAPPTYLLWGLGAGWLWDWLSRRWRRGAATGWLVAVLIAGWWTQATAREYFDVWARRPELYYEYMQYATDAARVAAATPADQTLLISEEYYRHATYLYLAPRTRTAQWFDARHAVVWPRTAPWTSIVSASTPVTPDMQPLLIHARGEPYAPNGQYAYVKLQGSDIPPFTPPTPLEARFGDALELRGTAIMGAIQPGAQLHVQLYCQATSTPGRELRVFVHLEDENGKIVAQQDALGYDAANGSQGIVSSASTISRCRTCSHPGTSDLSPASTTWRPAPGIRSAEPVLWETLCSCRCHSRSWRAEDTLENYAHIGAYLQQVVDDGTIPGAVLRVEHHGEPVYEVALGRRHTDPERPMGVDTLFDVASLTKVVATTGTLLHLFEQGILTPANSLGDFLPLSAPKRSITLEQCLTHTSGLPALVFLRRSIAELDELQMEYEPGTRVLYSDAGFLALGWVIEVVTGRRLDEIVQEHTRRWDMPDTMYNPTDAPRCAATEWRDSLGRYQVGEVHDENATVLGGVAGHAGLFSTARDLATYAQIYLRDPLEAGMRVHTLTGQQDLTTGAGWAGNSGHPRASPAPPLAPMRSATPASRVQASGSTRHMILSSSCSPTPSTTVAGDPCSPSVRRSIV